MPAVKKQADKQININLIINTAKEASLSGQVLSWAITYGKYIIIITQIVVLVVFFLRFKFDRDHTDLKELVSQKQALVESISDLESEIRRIQTKLTFINQVTTNQTTVLTVLRFLQDHLPSDIIFSTLAINKDNLSFNATTKDLRSFNYVLKQLQQDKKFSEVMLEDIIRQKISGRIEFKIMTKFNIQEFK